MTWQYRRLLLLVLLSGTLAHAGRADSLLKRCVDLLSRGSSRSADCRLAEQTLASYKPYDRLGFELKPLAARGGSSVFKGTESTHPDQPFVLKVIRFDEALGDYVGLKVLKNAQNSISTKINIVTSVILPPKSGKLSLGDKVVEKTPFMKGIPLVEILSDPKIPNARKAALHKKFTTWRNEIQSALADAGFEVILMEPNPGYFRYHPNLAYGAPDFEKSQPKILKATRPWSALVDWTQLVSGEEFDANLLKNIEKVGGGQLPTLMAAHADLTIFLKSDNVLVDDLDQLYLIDPY
jgi:hypothetical protein